MTGRIDRSTVEGGEGGRGRGEGEGGGGGEGEGREGAVLLNLTCAPGSSPFGTLDQYPGTYLLSRDAYSTKQDEDLVGSAGITLGGCGAGDGNPLRTGFL